MQDEPQLKSALIWVTGILKDREIPFQITGGLAATIYGSPRKVNDIDIDIPNDRFNIIYEDMKSYVTFGPARYKDNKWDCYLMTLNYKGQDIDISGADDTKITQKDNVTWVDLPININKSIEKEFLDLTLPIIPRQELINYKKHLDGEHQLIDIEYVNKG